MTYTMLPELKTCERGHLKSERFPYMLASKRKSIHAADDYELNGKLMRFAMSRGFELKDIKRCIDIPDEEEQID